MSVLKPYAENYVREIDGDHEKVEYARGSSIRIWRNSLTVKFSAHWHSAVEIIAPVKGAYTVSIHNYDYVLQPGDVIVIPPGELHELPTSEPGGERMIYLFDIDVISKIKGFSSVLPFFTSALLISKDNAPDIIDDVRKILREMDEIYIESEPLWELSIYAKIINLFVIIGQNNMGSIMTIPSGTAAKQKEYMEKFNAVFTYMDKHYMDDLTLEEVADIAGYSKYHFTRLFKQYSDTTFYDYLCIKRIRIAEELLINPSLSITEVALRSGFPSISTFNRMFKKIKKCTPTEYRNMRDSM